MEKNNSPNIKWIVLDCIFIVCICFIYIAGCRTITVTDQSVLEHQRRIAELEVRVIDYENRLRQYDSLVEGTVGRLEIIRNRADSIPDRIDRIIFLFEQYEREVHRILNEFDSLGRTTETLSESQPSAVDRYYSNVVFEVYPYNPWLY